MPKGDPRIRTALRKSAPSADAELEVLGALDTTRRTALMEKYIIGYVLMPVSLGASFTASSDLVVAIESESLYEAYHKALKLQDLLQNWKSLPGMEWRIVSMQVCELSQTFKVVLEDGF